MEIKGRSLLTGLPVRVNVSTSDLYEPVMRLSEQIGTAAHQVLEKTPPELAGDIYRNGVVLTGGGAQLHGLPEYLSQELKVEVTCRTERAGETVEAVKRIHPYEEPVINVIPLYQTGL